MNYKGYRITESTGHGQNVKGNKKTSTIRVIKDDGDKAFIIIKQFSYPVNDNEKKAKAIDKCIKYIDENCMCEECNNYPKMLFSKLCKSCVKNYDNS